MPEGDTIFRAATNLRKVLQSQSIESARGREELKIDSIVGTGVVAIESRGKHLVFHFDNDMALHSHMGMTGSWHIYRPDDAWHKPDFQAEAVLNTDRWTVVCFRPKLLELVTERQLLRNNYLQRLGPDILGPPIPDDIFLRRIRTQNPTEVTEALLNQTVVCGIGNVYKSELLFLARIHPNTIVSDLNNEQLLFLRDQAVTLLQWNTENRPRRTRFRGDEQKLWVYDRCGDPCLKCGANIQFLRSGPLARSTYYCPDCQS